MSFLEIFLQLSSVHCNSHAHTPITCILTTSHTITHLPNTHTHVSHTLTPSYSYRYPPPQYYPHSPTPHSSPSHTHTRHPPPNTHTHRPSIHSLQWSLILHLTHTHTHRPSIHSIQWSLCVCDELLTEAPAEDGQRKERHHPWVCVPVPGAGTRVGGVGGGPTAPV